MQKPDIYHCNDTLKSSNDKGHKGYLDFTIQKQETKKFLDALARKTACKITITFLDYEAKKGFVLNNRQPFKVEEAYNILEKENAWYKNVVLKKSVLFNFSKENKYFNVVLVDDIQDIEIFKRRDFFLLWNTSNKYQAAFLLDRAVTSEEVIKIQRMLIKNYGGDLGSLGASHNKKLPGFYNTKYPENPPYMKVEYIGTRVLDARYILEKYKEIYEKEEDKKPQQRILTTTEQNTTKQQATKTWQDYFNEKQNASKADIAYAIYLMDRGYTDEEITQALLTESQDIEIRKKGHLEDYLRRTLFSARAYYENFKDRR